MPKINWSSDQQKVIDTRNRNLLVAAAAGSGKTAVLVERILSIITDTNHPVDIDRLLVVTFTKAAAAEMRGRIGDAIEARLAKEPDNLHLQKQFTLLPSAQITTIDSFCLHVIQNYFHKIDLDPAFRIADDSELVLLQKNVVGNLLEARYEEGREEFCRLIEAYAGSRSDANIEALILRLYHYAASYPYPDEWLEGCALAYEETDDKKSPWIAMLVSYLKNISTDIVALLQKAYDISSEINGPQIYLPVLERELELAMPLLKAETYEDFSRHFSLITFDRLPSKKDNSVDPALRELAKEYRNNAKKMVADIQNSYLYAPLEDMFAMLQNTAPLIRELTKLAIDFRHAYALEKEEKGILDFADLEHFALKILVDKTEDGTKPSSCAKELRDIYEEILIDEYQDSNFVQEYILNSIAREPLGTPNIFMVGDVKQSIYKFRQARPELFMEKYDTYSLEDSKYQRIDLHQNFRSRTHVLDSVNEVFYALMTKKLGGIAYDDAAALYPGAVYPSADDVCGCISEYSELLLITNPLTKEEEEKNDATDKAAFITDEKEAEVRAVGKRILELTDPASPLLVKDGEALRPTQYRDIVILLRTMSGWSETFTAVLQDMGIPAYAETHSGYFSSIEVQTMLNFLRIIDNPRQEIPLTAVMRSMIIGMTDDELALLGSFTHNSELWDTIRGILNPGEEMQKQTAALPDGCAHSFSALKEHLCLLHDMILYYRTMSDTVPVQELLRQIYEDTHYYLYVSSMPDGEKRAANLDMLLQKAESFSGGSYHGLFQFVRYIEQLHRYDIDYGEASVIAENMNAVRIMSIHKSKGLEFPVVFVSGCGKNFNFQDARAKFVLHPELGIGANYVDLQNRIQHSTILKKIIGKVSTLDTLGEELRILYVALTRAKEKLIVTAFCKDYDDEQAETDDYTIPLSFFRLSSAKSYLDWLLPVVTHSRKNWKQRLITTDTLFSDEIHAQLNLVEKELALRTFDTDTEYCPQILTALETAQNWQYPYQNIEALPVKVSVSYLKNLDDAKIEPQTEAAPVPLLFAPEEDEENEPEVPVPEFLREKASMVSGASRGTAYHKVMEHLPYTEKIEDFETIKKVLDTLVDKKLLTAAERAFISEKTITSFARSSLAGRMKDAYTAHRLHREQPFVIGVPATTLYPEQNLKETILVQGIIDAWFEEDKGLVLVDYKTDRIPKGQGSDYLVERYQKQLDYYAAALSSITGKPVKEKLLYSFFLGKVISL